MLWAEWRVHEEAELARLRRQLESGGYSGVYFNTEGLLHTDFELGGELEAVELQVVLHHAVHARSELLRALHGEAGVDEGGVEEQLAEVLGIL